MADDAGNERELESIHDSSTAAGDNDGGAGGPPSVTIRKASTDVGAENQDDDGGRQQLQTPAPMASFEALSDAEESNEDPDSNGVDEENAEALRELATTLDIPSAAGGRQQHGSGGTRSKKSHATGNGSGFDPETDGGSASGSISTSASAVPFPPPPSPMTAGNEDDRGQLTEEDENDDDAAAVSIDPFATDDIVAEIAAASASGNGKSVPTVVLETVPDVKETDGADVDNAAEQTTSSEQMTWAGWTQDGDEGWQR